MMMIWAAVAGFGMPDALSAYWVAVSHEAYKHNS
jgi:hypothetical protein